MLSDPSAQSFEKAGGSAKRNSQQRAVTSACDPKQTAATTPSSVLGQGLKRMHHRRVGGGYERGRLAHGALDPGIWCMA
jgi:hypothetical protein